MSALYLTELPSLEASNPGIRHTLTAAPRVPAGWYPGPLDTFIDASDWRLDEKRQCVCVMTREPSRECGISRTNAQKKTPPDVHPRAFVRLGDRVTDLRIGVRESVDGHAVKPACKRTRFEAARSRGVVGGIDGSIGVHGLRLHSLGCGMQIHRRGGRRRRTLNLCEDDGKVFINPADERLCAVDNRAHVPAPRAA